MHPTGSPRSGPAWQAVTLELVRRAAHTLKANGLTFGAQVFAAACAELEQRGEARDAGRRDHARRRGRAHLGRGTTGDRSAESVSTSGDRLAGSVLVVEDDRINRLLLRRSLEADGHVVTMAENGRIALELLEDTLPDVILLDILMPELDGFAVLDSVKADPRLRDIPVIMISALDEMDSVVRCIEAGADDYLPKPFDPTLLRARINAGLTKRRLGRSSGSACATSSPGSCPRRSSTRSCATRTASHGSVESASSAPCCSATSAASRRSPSGTPPHVVVDVLNRYFGEMSDAILDNGGTLLGFLGDGDPGGLRRTDRLGGPRRPRPRRGPADAVRATARFQRPGPGRSWAQNRLTSGWASASAAGPSCRGTSARRADSSTPRSAIP